MTKPTVKAGAAVLEKKCSPVAGRKEVWRAARSWRKAGFAPVPIKEDGSKAPACKWKSFQTEAPDVGQIEKWFNSGRGRRGLGLVTGYNDVELLEFETEAVFDAWCGLVADAELDYELLAICDGYMAATPGGGIHLLYRCADVGPNQVLAGTAKEYTRADGKPTKVLIETRGIGGFVVLAPSGGQVHPTGEPYVWLPGATAEPGAARCRPERLAQISPETRHELFTLGRSLDRRPPPEPVRPLASGAGRKWWERGALPDADDARPGDEYNRTGPGWTELLESAGWTFLRERADPEGPVGEWRRPGKHSGSLSATTNHMGSDLLYVFSSNADPFESERSYDKFGAYAVLHHDGDWSAAARALSAEGYGGIDEGTFWNSRPALANLRQFAQARRVSPWAMLGVVLARLVTTIPPSVVLPPLVGSHASLNLFVALVGPSGQGKGTSENAAVEYLVTETNIHTETVGSGEGMAKMFAYKKNVKGLGYVQHDLRNAAHFSVSEVDNLAALTMRHGATLLPQLRMAWSGERLGFAYADPTKAVSVERHRYRLTLVLGVQPERAGPLLKDSDGGTPQRFLWFSTSDPDAPEIPPEPPARWMAPVWPKPMSSPLSDNEDKEDEAEAGPTVKFGVVPLSPLLLSKPVEPEELVSLEVPAETEELVREVQLAKLRGEDVGLDGHALLAREKVAAALMFFDGRHAEIGSEDWRLAGVVMAVSRRTRDEMERALREKASKENAQLGRAEGARSVAADEVRESAQEKADERAVERVTRNIRRNLAKQADLSMAGTKLRNAIRKSDRDHFESAVVRLEAEGELLVEEVPGQGQRGRKMTLLAPEEGADG